MLQCILVDFPFLVLSNIPSHGYTTICLSSYQLSSYLVTSCWTFGTSMLVFVLFY